MHCFPQCTCAMHSAHKITSAEHTERRKTQLGCSSSVRRQKRPLSRVATTGRIAACQGLEQCWLPSQGASRAKATRLNQSLHHSIANLLTGSWFALATYAAAHETECPSALSFLLPAHPKSRMAGDRVITPVVCRRVATAMPRIMCQNLWHTHV